MDRPPDYPLWASIIIWGLLVAGGAMLLAALPQRGWKGFWMLVIAGLIFWAGGKLAQALRPPDPPQR